MSRNSILNPWLCRAAGLLLGTSLSLSAWAGDTQVTVGGASATVTGASTVVNFPVTRSGDLSYDAYLSFQTQDGSATAGTNYSPLQGSWLLPAGVANLTIPVVVNGSNVAGADKTFSLNMLGISTLPPSFALAAQQDFPAGSTGSNPYAVFAADVNGDGKPDLIVADYAAGTVTVLLNTTAPGAPTPSFAAGQSFSVGSTTFAVVVADMNGDGMPDIVTSDLNDHTVSVLLNTTAAGATTASFAAAQTITLQAGSAASIAVADLNGDGKPDLVIGSNGNPVTVLINNTATDSATVQFIQQSVAVGANLSSTYVALADLDGDGKPDLIVTDSGPNANSVSVLLNTTAVGSQSVSFGTPAVMTTGTGPLMCAAADLNGDGKPDLVVVNGTGNSLSVFLNVTTPGTGTASFSNPQTFAVAGSPRSVVATDVDGDGRPDLLVAYAATTTTGISVLINTAEPGATAATFAAPQVFGTTSNTYFLAAADVNGDGLQDVIAKDGDNVIVFLNTTTPAGVGTQPNVKLTPASLAFGNQYVGTPSTAQTVTLQNTGTGPLTVTGIVASDSYAQDDSYAETDTCIAGSPIPVNGTCTITVTFTPDLVTSLPGGVTVTDNAGTQTVSLSGTGLPSNLGMSPASWDFGTHQVGTTSAAETFTLTNSGVTSQSGITMLHDGANSDQFTVTTTCGDHVLGDAFTLAANASCTVSVVFAPTNAGAPVQKSDMVGVFWGNDATYIQFTGTVPAAAASLSSTSLSFGSQPVSTTSTAQVVTLTNVGNESLSITNIAVASGAFAETNTCSTSLAPNASCTISVTFDPTTVGSQTGSITLTDNAAGSPQTISLSGIGAQPNVKLTPASLAFGNQYLGTPSAAQTVTLQNIGTGPLTVTGIVASDSYAQDDSYAETDTCIAGSPIPVNGTCTITVTFTPDLVTSLPGGVTVTDSAGTQTVILSGTGLPSNLGGSPASWDFGTHQVGTTSAAETFTLTNFGVTSQSGITLAHDGANSDQFTVTTTCGDHVLGDAFTLAANASCTINVVFAPTNASAPVQKSDMVGVFWGNDATYFQFTGTAAAAAAVASLSSTSLSFGNQTVSTTSTAQVVTLTNAGTASLSITSIAVASGAFAETNTCSTSLAPNASCTISVTFDPTTVGSQTGSITLTDNAAGSPQTISLSGTGTAAAAGLSPTSLTFGNQAVGTTSTAQTVTLTNTGNVALSLSIAATSPYAQTNTCGTSVAAGANCTISVTFTPTASGSQPGSITLTDNAAGSPQTISLSGTGLQAVAGLSPTSLTFGNQAVGTTSTAQTVTLTNTGSVALSLSVAATGPYAQTNTCGTSVAAGANCTLSVTFTPTASGSQPGSITLTDNAANSPQTISLSGTGQQAVAALSPATLTFAGQTVGTTSATQTVTLTNSGNVTLSVTNVAISGPFALQSNTCSNVNLAANGTCTLSVTFTPTASGSQTGGITLTDNAPNSPQTVSLSGTGQQAVAGVSPATLTFAGQAVGTTSAAQTVTLTNSGNVALNVATVTISGPFALKTDACSNTSVAASGGTCTLTVTYTATATGNQTGSISIPDNAAGSLQTVSLSGTGTQAAINVSPNYPSEDDAYQFPNTPANQTTGNPTKTFTITNSGTAPLHLSSSSFEHTGPNPYQFTVTNQNCPVAPAAVPAGGCTVKVVFNPSSYGSYADGFLVISTDQGVANASGHYAGTGTINNPSLSPASYSFGNVNLDRTPTAVFTLKNSNNISVYVSAAAGGVVFSISNTTCPADGWVASQQTCTVTVQFGPIADRSYTGTLTLTTTGAGTVSSSLSGTGTGVAQ